MTATGWVTDSNCVFTEQSLHKKFVLNCECPTKHAPLVCRPYWEIKSSYQYRWDGIFSKFVGFIHTSDFFPHKNFEGDPALVREFLFPE